MSFVHALALPGAWQFAEAPPSTVYYSTSRPPYGVDITIQFVPKQKTAT